MASAHVRVVAALLAATSVAHGSAKAQLRPESAPGPNQTGAAYTVSLGSIAAPRFTVKAEIPLRDDTLWVAQSWPCDLEALCDQGWPLLIRDLRVMDAAGPRLATESIGAKGWIVRGNHSGRLLLEYAVDYDSLADNGWPAPREAAFSDGAALFTIGRPLFVGGRTEGPARVVFNLPPGIHVATPWLRDTAAVRGFTVPTFDALVDNGFVLREHPSTPIMAGRFSMELALFGRWREQRELVTRLMHAHLVTFTRLLGFDDDGAYLAVFLEDPDMGGESFRSTHALSADPSSAPATWGRLIGHEVFHYWNGQRLRGADYTTSQWFQEGMSEYYAILSMARNGFITPEGALAELSRHLRAHRGFARSLAASGNRKDRGFYGTATLVAFILDVKIRDATSERHSLDELMRQMWTTFGAVDRPYTQADVLEAGRVIAGIDLAPFFHIHIEGDLPLPLDAVLPLVGLRLERNADGEESLVEDSAAPRHLQDRWRSLIGGRD